MKNKINIAELLKDCPKGMELDCTMFENVTFEGIKQDEYPIIVKLKKPNMTLSLTETGGWNLYDSAKCVIFPKGKTTWEGFQRPFKEGDIVVYDNPHRNNLQVFIFKNKEENNALSTCYLMLDGDELDLEEGMYYITRLATEEEKQKLFDAIKENGYKWNAETKTLEKLPKFKVGDIIQDKNGYKVKITNVSIEDECYGYESLAINGIGGIVFNRQDDWELVPNKFDINTLKVFDKVLVRDSNEGMWSASIFLHTWENRYICIGVWYNQCIPYEGNEHLLGTTNDCDEYYKTWKII